MRPQRIYLSKLLWSITQPPIPNINISPPPLSPTRSLWSQISKPKPQLVQPFTTTTTTTTTTTLPISKSHVRRLSGDSNLDDQNKVIDEINLKFAEAREEIEMAMESKETVYFDEEAECARDAVKAVLDMFDRLMAKLPETDKGALQRSMGLKIEQLKAELAQLNE